MPELDHAASPTPIRDPISKMDHAPSRNPNNPTQAFEIGKRGSLMRRENLVDQHSEELSNDEAVDIDPVGEFVQYDDSPSIPHDMSPARSALQIEQQYSSSSTDSDSLSSSTPAPWISHSSPEWVSWNSFNSWTSLNLQSIMFMLSFLGLVSVLLGLLFKVLGVLFRGKEEDKLVGHKSGEQIRNKKTKQNSYKQQNKIVTNHNKSRSGTLGGDSLRGRGNRTVVPRGPRGSEMSRAKRTSRRSSKDMMNYSTLREGDERGLRDMNGKTGIIRDIKRGIIRERQHPSEKREAGVINKNKISSGINKTSSGVNTMRFPSNPSQIEDNLEDDGVVNEEMIGENQMKEDQADQNENVSEESGGQRNREDQENREDQKNEEDQEMQEMGEAFENAIMDNYVENGYSLREDDKNGYSLHPVENGPVENDYSLQEPRFEYESDSEGSDSEGEDVEADKDEEHSDLEELGDLEQHGDGREESSEDEEEQRRRILG